MDEQECINVYINEIRKKRNTKLQETDKYMITDFPISDGDRVLILEYRQKLRDYISILTNNTSNLYIYEELFPLNPLNTSNILV